MYVTGSDAWNSQKLMSEARIGGKSPSEKAEGLPDAVMRGNQSQGLFLRPERDFSVRGPEPFAYCRAAPIFRS